MAIRIVTSAAAWARFVRRAKRIFPKEHCEALWGEETIDSFRITDFKRIKVAKATSRCIVYSDAEVARQKWLANKNGKVFLGTIHTHPRADFDTSPSTQDHLDGTKDGERLMGVVVLYKHKVSGRFVLETAWWFPQSKMEFVLLPD